ncbi:response regulator transcription factor [Maridesulfovibrio sp.]|uniref:response regulator transcription factor n=1 Tax=Maridesulfovibrio sp. TaxID=2795000 RepID=UPI002A18D228|nr:response regulator transcription factor [Maridesulfovibrio sp.]
MSEKNTAARVLLIDDHPAVRAGMRMLLETCEHKVVAEAGSCSEAFEILENIACEVALLDLTLHDRSGLELLPELEKRNIAALVYSMHETPSIIDRSFREGALGYVTKCEDPAIILEAIEVILHGKRFLSPYSAEVLDKKDGPVLQLIDLLSDRERQIYELLGQGLSNTEMAEKLDISPRTVETYFTRMVAKLEFENRKELRKYAISAGSI